MVAWTILDLCNLNKNRVTVAEWSRRTYPAPLGAGGVGSIPANSDAQNVPSFRRWRFEMKLSFTSSRGSRGAGAAGPHGLTPGTTI
jgi:hypothetical protein